QAALRLLVARVLALGELALLGRRQQPAVADLPEGELQRILRRACGVERVLRSRLRLRLVQCRNELQLGLALVGRLGGTIGISSLWSRISHGSADLSGLVVCHC